MGKTTPGAATAAAAPFTPESEKLRSGQAQQTSSGSVSAAGWSLSAKGTTELAASQDSLGNPFSPGHSQQQQQQGSQQQATNAYKQNSAPQTQGNTSTAKSTPRFHAGWDKLLVAQKNICSKAMNLLLIFEAPQRYFVATRSKLMNLKQGGIILDYHTDDERVITQQREAREASFDKKTGKKAS